MRRPAAVLGLCAVAWSGFARADVPESEPPAAQAAPATPGADQIQFAAREHDLGYRAYLEKRFDEAASHFENAFFAAPNPAELRSAIRARRDGGELARAATLAAIGLRRFPDDPATVRVAGDAIAAAHPKVYEVQISSTDDYSVAVDEKIVAAERVRESRVFVNPGPHELLVSWSDGRDTRVPIDAREGGAQSLHLEPPPAPVSTPPPAPAPTPVVLTPVPPPVAVGAPPESAPPPPSSKPFGPAVFITGAALTAVGAGLTVWSGVDALHNPGTAVVRQMCMNMGAECPEYKQGLAAQLRTNVFLGVTAGFAVVTGFVGLFFTDWSARKAPAPATGTVTPVVGLRQVGLEGTF
jgi:hypothetical protein